GAGRSAGQWRPSARVARAAWPRVGTSRGRALGWLPSLSSRYAGDAGRWSGLLWLWSGLGGEPREGAGTGVDRRVVELLLDAQELVVLGHALGPGGGAGLDLAAVGGHRQVGDRHVLGLARAVAHHAAVAVGLGQRDGVQGLGERPDLVDLHQQGVADTLGDAALQPLGVGDEQVVADQLDPEAESVGDRLPAGPVLLVERVLDGDQRLGVNELVVVVDRLVRGLGAALEGIAATLGVLEELAGSHVEGERDVAPRGVARLADRLDDQVERRAV